MACACASWEQLAASPRKNAFIDRVIENVNNKKMKKLEGWRWRCVMKYRMMSKMTRVNAVMGYNGKDQLQVTKNQGVALTISTIVTARESMNGWYSAAL